MRSGDREVGAWLRAARGPSRAAVTAGPQAQPQRQEEEEEEWHSRTRIRSTNRGVQTIRRGHHADPRPSNNGLHFVQRSRPGHVEVAHLRALCFLAGASARTMTSQAVGCRGKGPGKCNTGLDNCFAWRRILYITASLRWETICGG